MTLLESMPNPKRETKIVNSIRTQMLDEFGTILHKVHGGPYSETGASDLYGTLPGGRAIYVEVKTPETIGHVSDPTRKNQDAWLAREARLGAFTAVVDSYAMLEKLLMSEGIQKYHEQR